MGRGGGGGEPNELEIQFYCRACMCLQQLVERHLSRPACTRECLRGAHAVTNTCSNKKRACVSFSSCCCARPNNTTLPPSTPHPPCHHPPRFTSTTTRRPSRSDSSRMSLTPVRVPPSTRRATCSTSAACRVTIWRVGVGGVGGACSVGVWVGWGGQPACRRSPGAPATCSTSAAWCGVFSEGKGS